MIWLATAMWACIGTNIVLAVHCHREWRRLLRVAAELEAVHARCLAELAAIEAETLGRLATPAELARIH